MYTKIIEILIYFVIYSFLGWLLESTYKTIMQKKFVNSGFLHGPFCPIYGIGAIIMYIGLQKFSNNPIMVFTLGIIILSLWEYIVGWGLEKIFNTKYWDYSEKKWNIKGRICLFNSIIWGILGIIFTYIIHPYVISKIIKIPTGIMNYILIIAYAYLITDLILSTIKVKNISTNINKIHELSEKIKEKIEKIETLKKLDEEFKQTKIDTLQKAIDDLKLKQNKLKTKLYKYLHRLKKAFPTMKSEIITSILNEKIKNIKRNRGTKE